MSTPPGAPIILTSGAEIKALHEAADFPFECA
jgi:hypothetical protein